MQQQQQQKYPIDTKFWKSFGSNNGKVVEGVVAQYDKKAGLYKCYYDFDDDETDLMMEEEEHLTEAELTGWVERYNNAHLLLENITALASFSSSSTAAVPPEVPQQQQQHQPVSLSLSPSTSARNNNTDQKKKDPPARYNDDDYNKEEATKAAVVVEQEEEEEDQSGFTDADAEVELARWLAQRCPLPSTTPTTKQKEDPPAAPAPTEGRDQVFTTAETETAACEVVSMDTSSASASSSSGSMTNDDSEEWERESMVSSDNQNNISYSDYYNYYRIMIQQEEKQQERLQRHKEANRFQRQLRVLQARRTKEIENMSQEELLEQLQKRLRPYMQQGSLLSSSKPVAVRKRKRPNCLFVNHMGTRRPSAPPPHIIQKLKMIKALKAKKAAVAAALQKVQQEEQERPTTPPTSAVINNSNKSNSEVEDTTKATKSTAAMKMRAPSSPISAKHHPNFCISTLPPSSSSSAPNSVDHVAV